MVLENQYLDPALYKSCMFVNLLSSYNANHEQEKDECSFLCISSHLRVNNHMKWTVAGNNQDTGTYKCNFYESLNCYKFTT